MIISLNSIPAGIELMRDINFFETGFAPLLTHILSVQYAHFLNKPMVFFFGALISSLGFAMSHWAVTSISIPVAFFLHEFKPKIQPFVNKGIYKKLKHPLFTGISLMFFGLNVIFCTSADTWILASINLLSIPVYYYTENKRQEKIFGNAYLNHINNK